MVMKGVGVIGPALVLLAVWTPTMAAPGNTTCIRDPDIVNTTLPTRCFGLKNEEAGFTYQPTDPGTEELCSNQVTIKLNTFKSFCLLGDFVRVK